MTTITVDGRRVSFLAAGAGEATPVLCVHGFTGSKEDFAPVLDSIGRDRRALALDLPGHGGSVGSRDPDDYSLEALAAWVLAAADALGTERLHLVGHSLGGLIAQRAAAATSDRLRALVLVGTGVGAPDEEVLDHLAELEAAVADGGLAAGWQVQQHGRRRGADPVRDPVRERFEAARFHDLEPACVIGEARALREAAPVEAFLRGVDLPVLVVHGAGEDVWPGAHQDLLTRTIAGAERVVVEGAAHSPQVERPAQWAAAVTDFLRSADARL